MRGPSAAPHRAASAVKEAQFHSNFARHQVQVAMRAEDLPGAGQHAAVLVGVGVTQHNLLPVVPSGHQLAIIGPAPQLAANGWRIAQVFNGFEKRHRHQTGVASSPFQLHAAQASQTHHGQHIFHCGCAADHILAYCLWRAAVLDLRHHPESLQHACTLRRQPACQRLRRCVGNCLLQRQCMHPRMLANVESVQMKSKCAYLQDQRINQRSRNAQSAVSLKRLPQCLQIVEELLNRTVRRQSLRQPILTARQRVSHYWQRGALSAWLLRYFHRSLDACLQTNCEAAIVFEFILSAEELCLGRVHLLHVCSQPLEQCLADANLLCACSQQIANLIELPLVIKQQLTARQLNRIARHLRCDKGTAISVAADPRAEAEHFWQRVRLNLQTISLAQRIGNLAIKAGQRGKDRDVVVIQPHLDFVVNCGPARAHFVGLPKAGNLRANRLFQLRHLLIGNRNPVQLRQKLANAPPLEHHRAPSRLRGMRRKNRHNEHAPHPLQSLVRANPHAPHCAQGSGKRPALPRSLPTQVQCIAPPLAVIGLRQVDQLKVKCKGPRQLNRPLHRQRVRQLQGLRRLLRCLFMASARLFVPAANGSLPQRLHLRKQLLPRLLAQYLAQQHTQRTHIAPERSLFQLANLRLKLRQPLRPTLEVPQKSHNLLIMHERFI